MRASVAAIFGVEAGEVTNTATLPKAVHQPLGSGFVSLHDGPQRFPPARPTDLRTVAVYDSEVHDLGRGRGGL